MYLSVDRTVICDHFRTPDDWVLTCSGSGQIWVWGHNHRGQLGGVDGAKVKLPVSCDALAGLRPIQVVGGEQTLFAVTGDGKVRLSIQRLSHFSHFHFPSFDLITLILTLFFRSGTDFLLGQPSLKKPKAPFVRIGSG